MTKNTRNTRTANSAKIKASKNVMEVRFPLDHGGSFSEDLFASEKQIE